MSAARRPCFSGLRGAWLVAALSSLAGCGARAAEPTVAFAPEPPSADRLETTLPATPLAFRSFSFDYGALPRLEPVALDGPLPDASFAIAKDGGYQALIMTDGLMAEVRVGDLRMSRATSGGVPVERSPITGAEAVCGRNVSTRATWQGYVKHGSNVDSVTFACFEGMFDGRSCSVQARRAWMVEAPRIAEGGVFAFRSIEGACGAEVEHTVGVDERLDVIGPRPAWIGSTDPRAIGPNGTSGLFAHVTIPVSRGSSASAVLDVGTLDLLSSVRQAPAGVQLLSYSFEIVWPEGARAPSATAFVSAVRGDPARVTPPPDSRYTFTDG